MIYFLLVALISPFFTTHTTMDNKTLFKLIYEKNSWPGSESRSGKGSGMQETPIIRLQLPSLLKKYDIKMLLDVGCGEFVWQNHMNLDFLSFYMGIDIVEEVIAKNNEKYATNKRSFEVLDIVEQEIPTFDMIICRDVLQHLSDADIQKAIMHMKLSRSKYLLTSTFRNKLKNEDPVKQDRAITWRVTGKGRNLQLPPFNFPPPIDYINEGFEGKTLGLWRIEDLPNFEIDAQEQKAPHNERIMLLENI